MNALTIILVPISSLIVLLTLDIHSFTIWVICLGIAILLRGISIGKSGSVGGKAKIILNSFLILSIYGCILNWDNLNNFGTVFGYAGDDGRFFNKIKLLVSGIMPQEFGLFEILFGAIAFILENTIAPNFNLTVLLPINWLLGSIICYLCQSLAWRVTGQEVPDWIIFVTLLLNYQFVDAIIRLYRESLLYCFYVSAIYLMCDKRYVISLPFLLISGLVRGANAYLLVIFGGLNFLRQKIYNNAILLIVVMMGSMLAVQTINYAGDVLFDYASDMSRSGRYREAYADYSLMDRLEARQESLRGRKTGSSITNNIYHSQGIVEFVAKPVISLFFPLTIRPLMETRISHSPHATTRIAKNGLFLFNIVENFMILSWVVVFPLFVIGFWNHLLSRDSRQTLALFFLTALVVIANISGQMRHGIAFFVLMPCFVASGFSLCRSSVNYRYISYGLGSIMFFGIFALNIFKAF